MANRVGIVTWYSYENYGTVLQAVALNKAVQQLGYDAIDISYDPALGRLSHEAGDGSLVVRIKNKAKYLYGVCPLQNEMKSQLFSKFIKDNLSLTEPVEAKADLRQFNHCFDAFVCGSDQVWSPRCFDSTYYLDFVTDENRMVAYAPSFGCDSIDQYASVDSIETLLNRFNHVAVRETTGADIVEKYTGHRPTVVLDPTLLLTAKTWKQFAAPVEEGGPYCVVYFLGDNGDNWKAALNIAKSKGLRVVVIPVFNRDLRRPYSVQYPVGPGEFLSLISNAELVCTDSFHGMVFSTIFRRDYIAFERFNPKSKDSQNTRVYSFLEMTGAQDRLLSRTNLKGIHDFISRTTEFSRIVPRVDQKRIESIDYLRRALAEATLREGGDL